MSKFQIILLVVFGVLLVLAVLVFSLMRNSGGQTVNISIWGTVSSQEFNSVLKSSGLDSSSSNVKISYTSKFASEIESDFTEALAVGMGPDLIILTQDMFWNNTSKLIPIPYQTVTERTFKDTFIEEGELFLTSEGIYALPFFVDPMVLYYNRDHLTRAGIANPIAYWDEIYSASSNLTVKDPAGNITKSAIALGESINIPHYKDIMSLLMLQAGTPITRLSNAGLQSVMSSTFSLSTAPGLSALDFYTQFSNPARPFHTWNRSLLPAQTHFTAGDSTYYLGFASELRELRAKNPTLNLGVASVPQSRTSDKRVTFGRVYGISVTRGSRNAGVALSTALSLVSKSASQAVASNLFLPPARRDLLSVRPSDSALSVFYESAIQSKGWIDPDSTATRLLFRELVDSVTSGRARSGEALSKASRGLDVIINK